MSLVVSCVKCSLKFTHFLFAVSISAAMLFAQSADGLSGQVTDSQGGAVSDARVTLFRQDTALPQTVRTDKSGEYRFTAVTPGNLLLEVKKEGFRTTTLNIALQRGAAKHQDVMLQVAGVNQSVIVTAAGEAQTPDEVSKSVSVISHDEIVNRNDYSVAGLLTTVPGVQIFNQGGPGQYTKMSIHGLPASAGAILVDGLRFRDAATTQGDATSFLPALNVVDTDHVEVLRGSGSSLYGTNAIGGAVNIVTDQGGGPLHGQAQVEGGNLGLFRARGTIAGGALQDKLKYTFGLLHLNVTSGVDGQDAYRSSGLQSFARYDFTPQLGVSGRFWGSDDFSQLNNTPTSTGIPPANIPSGPVVSAIPLPPDGVKTLIAGGTPNFGNATYIPNINDPDDRNASRFENAAIVFRDIATPTFNWQGYYQLVHTERVYHNGPVGIGPFQPAADNFSDYVGRIDTVGVRANKQIAPWLGITGGYEFERETYFDHQDNNLPDPENVIESTHAQQQSHAEFFAAQFSPLNKRLQISLSGRLQTFSLSAPDFQYSGTENPYENISLSPPKALTGDASIAYLFMRSNTKLRAHVGNSYRSPALFERFGAGFYNDFVTGKVVFTPYGDPRLAPDRYNSFDGGIDQYLFHERVRASATVFYIRIAQLIGFNSNGRINPVTDPFGRSSGYINGAGGISRGGEVSLEARPTRSLIVSAAYTYTNADTDQDSQVPGFFHVFDTPKHMVTLVATNQWTNRLTTTVDMFHYSSYFDPSIGYLQAYQFPGFTKTNFVASYEFWRSETKSARFYAKVDNLFDQTFYVAGFLAPRTTVMGGVGYAF
jgi:iron complex outermembrane receptor protein